MRQWPPFDNPEVVTAGHHAKGADGRERAGLRTAQRVVAVANELALRSMWHAIYHRINRCRLPFIRNGRRIWFDRDAVEGPKWLCGTAAASGVFGR
jgi:hypothetical protein